MLTKELDTTLANGNVDEWLLQLEKAMVKAVEHELRMAEEGLREKKRKEWVLDHCGQATLALDMVSWTRQTESAIMAHSTNQLHGALSENLREIVSLIEGELAAVNRLTLEALIVLFVHNIDITGSLPPSTSLESFDWQQHLRYYFDPDREKAVATQILNCQFSYSN